MSAFRIGHGYDVHRLTRGRDLILCGVKIPYETGLDGHSDADVALHALMDALLGAAGLGDIGRHFPDTSEEFRGIDSRILLARVMAALREKRYVPSNVDVTIIAQKPKLLSHLDAMRDNVASDLGLDVSFVNIKATTEEHLGFTGSGQGIAAHAVCLIEMQ